MFTQAHNGIFANGVVKPSKANKRHHIAIIGGGPAGVSNLVQLVKLVKLKGLCKEVRITIIEKDKHKGMGPGLPFNTAHDCHIINLPIEAMSPIPDKVDDFAEWLKANETMGECWRERYPDYDFPHDRFPPRSLYGLYLKSLYNRTLKEAAKAKIPVTEIFAEAIDVRDLRAVPDAKRFEIGFKDRDFITADQVISCIGHLPTSAYRQYAKDNIPGYYHDPWDYAKFDAIPNDAQITILGSRLSAIDVLLYLKEVKHHSGVVTFVSRSGLLPAVIAEPELEEKIKPRYYPKVMTLDSLWKITGKYNRGEVSLKDLMSLFWRELNGIHYGNYDEELPERDREKLLYPPLDAEQWLIKYIAKSKERCQWQEFLIGLYEVLPKFWKKLSSEDQFRFLERFNSILMTYLAAFPRKNAEKLLAYINNGDLKVVGGLEGVTYDKGKGEFSLSLAGDRLLKANYVINATGPGYNIDDSLLLRNMVKRGIIRPRVIENGDHKKVVGVDVNSKTLEVIAENGELIPGLFCVGEQGHGVLFTTTDQGQVATLVYRAVKAEFKVLRAALKPHAHTMKTSGYRTNGTPSHGGPVISVRDLAGMFGALLKKTDDGSAAFSPQILSPQEEPFAERVTSMSSDPVPVKGDARKATKLINSSS